LPLPNELEALVNEAVSNDHIGINPGGCGEIVAIVNAGYPDADVEGGFIHSEFQRPGKKIGQHATPCDTCKYVLGVLGISY
jgi:hypothetical protein